MKMKHTIPWSPALIIPVFLRNVLVARFARGDAKDGYYSCRDRIVRWLGHYIPWDPVKNEIHKFVTAALQLPTEYAQWQAEREAAEKDLAQRPNYYVLLVAGIILYIADVMSDLFLLKGLGVEEGPRRALMALALAAVLFGIMFLAVKFFANNKLLFWAVTALGVLLAIAISIVQLQMTTSTNGTATFADVCGAILLSFGVVGPPALAKLVMGAWFPVAQLRAERRRLRRMQRDAKRAQTDARRYIDHHHRYTNWYKSHAKQIASVYRPAFARMYLRTHGDHATLAAMIAADDNALERDQDDTPNDPPPTPPARDLKLVPKNKLTLEALDDFAHGRVHNPYRRNA